MGPTHLRTHVVRPACLCARLGYDPNVAAVVRRRVRSYRLRESRREVLQALRAGGVPILERAESGCSRLRSVHARQDVDGSVVLHAPWQASDGRARPGDHLGGMGNDTFEIGPGLRLRTRGEGTATRLDVEVLEYAPSGGQRRNLGLWLGGAGVLIAAGFVVSGGSLGVAAGIVAVVGGSGMAPFVALVATQRRKRQQEIKDLLALVERIYAPLELPAVDGSPER